MEDRLLYRVTEVAVFLNVSRSRSSSRSPLPTCRGWTPCSSPTATTTTTASLRSLRSRTPHGRADLSPSRCRRRGPHRRLGPGRRHGRTSRSQIGREPDHVGRWTDGFSSFHVHFRGARLQLAIAPAGAGKPPACAPWSRRGATAAASRRLGPSSRWRPARRSCRGCRLIWSPTFLACCSRRRRGFDLGLEYPTDVNARPAVVPWKLRPATI